MGEQHRRGSTALCLAALTCQVWALLVSRTSGVVRGAVKVRRRLRAIALLLPPLFGPRFVLEDVPAHGQRHPLRPSQGPTSRRPW